MYDNNFQKRMQYSGTLTVLLEKFALDYNLGKYSTRELVTVGYEDLNIILTNNKNKYLIKVLADFRT